jgi:ParB/RepB/Spo0J family partition protein
MLRDAKFTWLPIDKIFPDPDNPRETVLDRELVTSIKKYGILVPIEVWQSNSGYIISKGHRRWAAAKQIGLKEVPVLIVQKPGDREKLVSLREDNQVRRSFTLKEDLEMFKRYRQYLSGVDEEHFIKQARQDFGSKANKLIIYLKWPDKVLEQIEKGKINASWVEYAERCVNTLINRFKNDWPDWLAPPEILRNLFMLWLEMGKLPKCTRSDIVTTPTLYKAKIFFEKADEDLIKEFFVNAKITLGDALSKSGNITQKEAEISALNALRSAKGTIMKALQKAESIIEKKGAKKIVEEIIELCWDYLENNKQKKRTGE